jgi:hypothetical protein
MGHPADYLGHPPSLRLSGPPALRRFFKTVSSEWTGMSHPSRKVGHSLAYGKVNMKKLPVLLLVPTQAPSNGPEKIGLADKTPILFG